MSMPEMNHVRSTFAVTGFTSALGHVSIPVYDLNQGYTEPHFPIIPSGTTTGSKIGRRCTLRRMTIKWLVKRDWTSWGEKIHFWIVRKSQTNRVSSPEAEIWDTGSANNASNQFRNPRFLEQYTVLKHWTTNLIASGQDDANYLIIGVVNGFVPSFASGEKTFTLSDNYENDDGYGRLIGNVGASYCLWVSCEGLSDGWISTNAGMSISGAINVAFTEK